MPNEELERRISQFKAERREVQARSESTGSRVVDFIGGTASGVFSDPLVEGLIRLLPGDQDNLVSGLQSLGGTTPAANAGRVIGEFGTLLAPGIPAFNKGAQLGRRTLQFLGRNADDATKLGPQAFISSLRERQKIGRFTPAELLEQGALSSDEVARLGGLGFRKNLPLVLGGPGSLERVSEIAGANLALSGLVFTQEGTRAIIEGDEFDDAARAAALTLVLGAGFEGGITALGRAKRLRGDLGLGDLLPRSLRERLQPERFSIENPFTYARPEPNTPQLLRRSGNIRAALLGSKNTNKRELAEYTNDSLVQVNRILGGSEFAGGRSIPFFGKVKGALDKSELEGPGGAAGLMERLNITPREDLARSTIESRTRRITQQLGRIKEYRRQEALLDSLSVDRIAVSYVLDGPAITSSTRADFENIMLHILKSPEQLAPQLGGVQTRAMYNIYKPIEVEYQRISNAIAGRVTERVQRTRKLFGYKNVSSMEESFNSPDVNVNLPLAVSHFVEKHGGNKPFAVAQIARNVKKVDGSPLSLDEADEAFEIVSGMVDDGLNGFAQVVNGQEIQVMQGFQALVDADPSTFILAGPERLTKLVGGTAPRHLPHQTANIGSQAIDDIMYELVDEKTRRRIATLSSRHENSAFAMDSSLDFQRHIEGTLAEKLRLGLPMEPNLFRSHNLYLNQIARRHTIGKRLGYSPDELAKSKKLIAEATARENAVVDRSSARAFATQTELQGKTPPIRPNPHIGALSDNIFDHMVGRRYESEAMRKFAAVAVNYNIASKLTFAVIPNAMQQTQTAVYNGFRATFKGFNDHIKGVNRDVINYAINATEIMLDENLMAARHRPFRDGRLSSTVANTAQWLAEKTLKISGFGAVERFNRRVAANASFHRGVDLVTRAAGMADNVPALRGRQVDFARRQARSMGFDLDDVAAKVRASGISEGPNGERLFAWFDSDEGRDWVFETMFNGAQQTQFLATSTKKPILWDHPYGRVAFQFKTFSAQQYRFVRDMVVGEAARGNTAPLFRFTGIAPIAGELVGDVKNIVNNGGEFDRNSDGFSRFAQNVMYIGGAGVLSDMIRASQFEQLGEFGFGPTAGQAVSISEFLLRGDVSGAINDITDQPAGRAGRLLGKSLLATGGVTLDFVEAKWEALGDSQEGATGKAVSPGVTILEDALRKQRNQ